MYDFDHYSLILGGSVQGVGLSRGRGLYGRMQKAGLSDAEQIAIGCGTNLN